MLAKIDPGRLKVHQTAFGSRVRRPRYCNVRKPENLRNPAEDGACRRYMTGRLSHVVVLPRDGSVNESQLATAGFRPVTQDVEILFMPHVLLDERFRHALRLVVVLRTAERR